VAFDPEHRLVLQVVTGKRSRRRVRRLVRAAKRRTGYRMMRLLITDEYNAYRHEILDAYGFAEPLLRANEQERLVKLPKQPRPNLLYVTLHKTRRKGRVVKVEPRLQFGTQAMLDAALTKSKVSTTAVQDDFKIVPRLAVSG